MTVTLDLSADMEDALKAMAAQRGMALPEVILGLLETQIGKPRKPTIEERIAAWRNLPTGLPEAPRLATTL